MSQFAVFPPLSLPADLVADLVRFNPWWEGKPGPALPPFRRAVVGAIHKKLRQRLAPIVTVRGPRQVGKTTAQLHVIEDLLQSGVDGRRILRVQCDEIPALRDLREPILRLADWFERAVLEVTLNEAARAGRPGYLFFDEVQNLADWAPQLKHLVDGSSCQVVVTGSSALRIEQGRDSLAGRIAPLDVGALDLREVAALASLPPLAPGMPANGVEVLRDLAFWNALRDQAREAAAPRDRAFALFSERGGYPLAHAKPDIPWSDIAEQLNETVVKRVIEHDLRLGERGRKRDPRLLEHVFRLGCRYAGQAPAPTLFAREAARELHANVGPQRVLHYLKFLDNTLLLRLVPPLEIRLKRVGGPSKICLADHGLRAAWLQEVVPLDSAALEAAPHLFDLAGHVAESVVGYFLSTISGLGVAHFPARGGEPEVDFVLTVGKNRIPLEVKYRRRIDPYGDTEGLRAFMERTVYNAPFGLLVTLLDDVVVPDPRIVALPLSSLLLLR